MRSEDEGDGLFPSPDNLASEYVCTEFEIDDKKDQALWDDSCQRWAGARMRSSTGYVGSKGMAM